MVTNIKVNDIVQVRSHNLLNLNFGDTGVVEEVLEDGVMVDFGDDSYFLTNLDYEIKLPKGLN